MGENEFKEQLIQFGKQIEKTQELINKSFVPFRRITQQLENAGGHLNEIIQALPEDQKLFHSYLSSQGWYLPTKHLPIDAPNALTTCLKEEKYLVVEDWIKKYIKDSIPWIEYSISDQFPNRAKILNMAVDAHHKKAYTLSIPTLLAQAEGIFHDIVNTDFYSNNEDNLEKIKRKVLVKLSEKGAKANTTSLGF